MFDHHGRPCPIHDHGKQPTDQWRPSDNEELLFSTSGCSRFFLAVAVSQAFDCFGMPGSKKTFARLLVIIGLASLWAIEENPDREISGEILEPVGDAGGGE